jgi:hypothetical protein
MGRCGRASGGTTDGVAGGLVDAVLTGGCEAVSGRLPAVVQAVRTADAAAIEKLRRVRRGVDCVNDFSSNGAGPAEGSRAAAFQANRIARGVLFTAPQSR